MPWVRGKMEHAAPLLLRVRREKHLCDLFQNILHAYSKVTFIKYTFTILYQQHLRGFMVNVEVFGDLIGKRTVGVQVQVMKVYNRWCGSGFQSCFYYRAYTTAGRMFKDQLGFSKRLLPDICQLPVIRYDIPVHYSITGNCCIGSVA